MKRLFLILSLFCSSIALSKVAPPNYDFSLDQLSIFMPGTKIAAVEKTLGKGERVDDSIRKYQIEYIRYKFPVFVQVKDGEVNDFYASLPSYFLHDVFHQSLINRYKMQDKYKNVNESSVYVWNNIKGNTHVYAGACSITCFPLYYTVYKVGDTETILSKLRQNANFLNAPKF